MQATQAYLVGNKALAKELGAKGRHHSDQMKAAHAAASENIFLQRNMRNASSVVSNKNGVCTVCCNQFESGCTPPTVKPVRMSLDARHCRCLDCKVSKQVMGVNVNCSLSEL